MSRVTDKYIESGPLKEIIHFNRTKDIYIYREKVLSTYNAFRVTTFIAFRRFCLYVGASLRHKSFVPHINTWSRVFISTDTICVYIYI